MGGTTETPTVKVMLTKTNAARLTETLAKYRDQLSSVTDDVGKAQHDFLDEMVGVVGAALNAAASEAETKTATEAAAAPAS